MANKIGRFEILSEITHSEIGAVYKAADPESGQTIALKTIQLQMLAEQADTVMQYILQEAAGTSPLSSHNIAQLIGVEQIDTQCCAAMEYVQGNSIATMLARKEGFSIWDLQDIVRQTCQGLDHAHSHNVVHYSLEPAKIMVTWDGTVKVLSFGVSCMGAFTCQASGKAPEVLHYVSPEQLRGDPVDGRSNIFSLGAILYEMATETKAFPGDDADQVRHEIVEVMPAAPVEVNRKIHPVLSEVIMKALSKVPEERYQSGQELVNDLERCKESATKVVAKKPAQPAQGLNAPSAQKPAAAAPPKPAKGGAGAGERTAEDSRPVAARTRSAAPSVPTQAVSAEDMAPPASARAAAAAAGWESPGTTSTVEPAKAKAVSGPARASGQSTFQERASAAAETVEPASETPAFQVDPAMAEEAKGATRGPSFSEMTELPPLKEIYIAPPPPPVATESEPEPVVSSHRVQPEKPKVQPREVARKAVKEIKKTPPKLFLYSIAGAVVVILLVVGVIAFRIHSENSEDEGSAPAPAAAAPAAASAKPVWSPAQPPVTAATQAQPEQVTVGREAPAVSVVPKYGKNKKRTKAQPVVSATVVPGQLNINSTPEGAEVRIDGRSDPGWVTPFNLAGLAPGQHSVTVARAGYAPESRTIDVGSGSKLFLVIQLAQITAAIAISSQPAGAQIFIDGKDTGRVTPAQISVDKPGAHTFLVRKQGYLEQTSSANLQAGQVFHFAPTLKALGSTDDIKIGGRFKKLFGGGDTAGMGAVNIKTQPKGAQVAVNNRIVDKFSPVDFYLNPGTYVIDVTMSGFKPVHRVVDVEKGGKVAIDENLDRQ
ncbi:MAG: PEGA domain-containing protein [Terriglobales bacterium]